MVVEQLAIAIEQANLYERSLQAAAQAQAQTQQLEKNPHRASRDSSSINSYRKKCLPWGN